MYEGEITALLGHNGAGKTTIMSMNKAVISPSYMFNELSPFISTC
jgi:ATP-binding cassette subfamily A (ABC1) protein 3